MLKDLLLQPESRRATRVRVCECVTHTHLGGEVSFGLELFEEGGQKEGSEEQNDRPEEDIWDEGTIIAAGQANELPV